MRKLWSGLAVLSVFTVQLARAEAPNPKEGETAQTAALVEALRQAAPDTGREDDGLYTAWQIREPTLRRWTKRCAGGEMAPAEFEKDEARIRTTLACVMGPILQEQLAAAQNNEDEAVRRAAAWWMTGDVNQWNSADHGKYTQKVLDFYKAR